MFQFEFFFFAVAVYSFTFCGPSPPTLSAVTQCQDKMERHRVMHPSLLTLCMDLRFD